MRKSIENEVRSRYLSIHLTPTLAEKLFGLAKKRGVSANELVIGALKAGLKEVISKETKAPPDKKGTAAKSIFDRGGLQQTLAAVETAYQKARKK